MSDSDCDSEEEVSGMIRSTLIHELKAILDEYPDNGQILKELIQNAEDAGASEIKIIFDSDGGGHKTYHHPHLNGPSLYVYNDALFTEKDWTGIKMLRKSVKEHDPLKVGRFGLGFNSVFHLTDYPSVLSGDTLLFLDPGKPECKACSAYPLKRKGKTITAMIESQASVFDHLNTHCTDNRNFHGTLFRFPLRTVPTELSTLTHDRSRILNLMKTCETELEFVLIFLKSLSKVELIHLESYTTSNVKFSVLLHENSKQQRKLQKESLQKALTDKIPYHSTTDLNWAVEKQDGGRCDQFKQTCKVTNVYLGKDCMSVCMRTLCDDPILFYCPYVSVAFMDFDERCLVKGHVFCFLPLQDSTMTGLPVFVNGFFALSSNRHHLKWPTSDEEGSSWEMQKDKACLWNHCLITEALPQVYRTLLLELKEDCESHGNIQVFVNRLYKAFPDPSLVSRVWKPLVHKLYSHILDDDLFWTNCDGGKWVSVREAIFVLESNNENNTATSMILLQQRICFVPDHILKAVSQYMASQVTVLYPSLVRTVLKKSEQYQSLERTRKLDLLSYILSDITEDSIEELEGIVLIPLANGSFTTFKERPPVYIATEDFPKSLFPFLDTDFLADVPEEIQQHMNRVSQFEESCLQVVDKEVIPSLVNRVLQIPPREELTTRLRGFLNGFPCDEAIFNELLQNADDAGASRMVFVKDLRYHGNETVFSDNWKYLQGPALCVYNDKPFTKEDIEGIQKGSKSQDQLKTGKSGVGFNAVYHITDVPSFITKSSDEEILCVFDPNREYVPNITNNQSGRKYNRLNLHRKRFPDVYSCYPQELMEEGGTLFRFPLRTKEMAQLSKIKNDDFTIAKLEKLVDRFRVVANECLLFLKTVRTIQFFQIIDDGGMVCEYEVKAEVDNALHFNIELQTVVSQLKSGGKLQHIEPKTFKSCMKIKGKNKGRKLHETTWYIEQRIGFENVEELPENLINAFDEGRIGCLPTGGLAFPINPQRKGNQKAFRHLPLPVTTHLPVAVDAHFVLDHENRRNIYSSQNKDLSATWNLQLAENLLAPLYASALFNLINEGVISPEQITKYYNYFPSCLNTSGLWKELSISTYKYLDRKSFPVLIMSKKGKSGEIAIKLFPPTGLAENKAYFDTVIEERTPLWPRNDTDDTLTDIIKRLDFNLIDTPNWIQKNFLASNVEVLEVNPTAVLKYLRSHSSVVKLRNGQTDIKETSFQSRWSLLCLLSYCCSSEEIQNLELLPLRLTCDQRLYFFQSSDPVYMSIYHSTWEKSSGRFLDLTAASKMQMTDETLKEHTQVVPLMTSDLKELLPLEIDSAFVKGVPIERKSDGSGLPNSGQIRLIWTYLNGQVKGFTGKALQGYLRCLSKWPLIPVTRVVDNNVKKLLAPISFASQIICESEHDKGLLEQLKAQGMLTLDKEDFQASYCTLQSLGISTSGALILLQSVVISTSDALCLLQGISLMLAGRPLRATCNQLNQITEILPYFGRSDSLRQLQSNPSSKDQLKKLPFYVTLSDTTTDIATCSAIMISQTVPQNGIKSLLRKHDIVILKNNSKLTDLYQYLDVTVKSDIEFYCQYICKWFHELNKTDQMTHLLFVRDRLISDDKNKVLQNSLQHLAFIPYNGVLNRASCFYYHEHPVFSTMLESNKFVPNPFLSYKWHNMLKLSGLITSVPSDLFVSLTKQLEAEACNKSYDKDTLQEKSELLVRHLVTDFPDVKHTPIYKQICKVNFLVSNLLDSKLKEYGPFLQRDSEMICFHGSFYPKYLKLIWTVGKILPKYAESNQLPPALGVPEKPSVHLVVRNLLNIIRTVESSNILQTREGGIVVKDLEDIFKTHYEFLQQCSRSELQELKVSKCILVLEHRCLARPDMVVQALYRNDLKPYLVPQSLKFGPFCELFETLGVAKKDSIRHYVNVLRLIKDSTGDKCLHPNEMKVVITALIAIEETLRKANKDEDMSSEISQLYLPVKSSDKVVLIISTETVILDRVVHASFRSTFHIVADFGDSIRPMELYKVLPIEHRPHLVSNLIFEELTTSCRLKCVKTPICCQLESSIKSEELLEGVVRLLKHKNVANNEMLDEHQESLKTWLRCIRVFSVTEIETHYIFDGKTLPESRSDKRWLTSRSEDNSEIHMIFNSLWLENESFDKFICFAIHLCNEFQDIPGMVLVAEHFSILLRLVFNNESIENYLNREGITKFCDHKETKLLLPPAGTYIPVDYHDLLDASFTFFDNGEYVGFELFDPLHDEEDGDPVYIYAIILEQVQEMPNFRWNWQRQYRVNLGQDIKVVSATDLYKLHRKQTTIWDVEIYTPDKSLKDVKEEIFEMLKDVWEIEDMRKKVIKRLLLTWHPDKNIGKETFCTKVTQYILKLIERFMAGNFKKMADDDVTRKSGFEESWCNRNAGFYSNCFKHTSRRAGRWKIPAWRRSQRESSTN